VLSLKEHVVGTDVNQAKITSLLYPAGLQAEDLREVRHDEAGVIWLGKKKPA